MRFKRIENLKEKKEGSIEERRNEYDIEEKDRKKKVVEDRVDSNLKYERTVSRIRDEFEKKKTKMILSKQKERKKVPVPVLETTGRSERSI